jgi:flagellar motor switch protein FliM
MSDVLDQSEVDALLAAAKTGDLGEPEQSAPAPAPAADPAIYAHSPVVQERDARDYDFKRPERVSKDQMRSLESLHESFARNLGASLSGFLRTIIECRVATIEQLTYSEFIHSLPNPTCFNLIQMPPLEGQMCLELSPLIVYPILDRLMGGSNAELFIPQRPLTSIELRLVKRITDQALECLSEAWTDLEKVEFGLVSTESNPQLVQIVAPNEVVVVVGFEIKMGARAGTMSLCIPFNVIEPVIAKLGSQSWYAYTGRVQREDQTENISSLLSRAKLLLKCYLAETRITINDLAHLQVGDIIQTGKSHEDDLILQIEGRNKFAGKIGQFRGSRALRIGRRAAQKERL